MTPTLRDYDLEGEICRTLREYKATTSRFVRRKLLDRYKTLRARRSPRMREWLARNRDVTVTST